MIKMTGKEIDEVVAEFVDDCKQIHIKSEFIKREEIDGSLKMRVIAQGWWAFVWIVNPQADIRAKKRGPEAQWIRRRNWTWFVIGEPRDDGLISPDRLALHSTPRSAAEEALSKRGIRHPFAAPTTPTYRRVS